ncbi:hypothetical protein Cgig2_017393 [Carnegiea gigantea]|uniref:Germin-like protein n=1 Tax=Carnegiea gigantea TaxID=171969 RepID=A0A9Q1GLV8_9CARY|nr:hypothetical protein Cgig2_017393 [Carnegiea gigantea]
MEMIRAADLPCISLFAVSSYVAYAIDPNQLQDCSINGTKDPQSACHFRGNATFVHGLFCKDPMGATPEDSLLQRLHMAGNMANKVGPSLPGLNTLGISIAHIDFAPNGLNPPHTPRAMEVLILTQVSLLILLNPGDVFVFPQGLIHFQLNVGNTPAAAIAALSSQNPGIVTVVNAVFGSNPPMSVDVLTRAFRAYDNVIKFLQTQFQM